MNNDENVAVCAEHRSWDIFEAIEKVDNDPESEEIAEELNIVSSQIIKKHMQKWRHNSNISKVETVWTIYCLQKVSDFVISERQKFMDEIWGELPQGFWYFRKLINYHMSNSNKKVKVAQT